MSENSRTLLHIFRQSDKYLLANTFMLCDVATQSLRFGVYHCEGCGSWKFNYTSMIYYYSFNYMTLYGMLNHGRMKLNVRYTIERIMHIARGMAFRLRKVAQCGQLSIECKILVYDVASALHSSYTERDSSQRFRVQLAIQKQIAKSGLSQCRTYI